MPLNTPLLILPDENAYRAHFVHQYCNAPVMTFDNIAVQFFPNMFDHAFYRDSSPTAGDKAIFALPRAQRMDWISALLGDPTAELYRRIMPNSKVRRIALEPTTPYAVIIQISAHDAAAARFMTAFVVDSASALNNMRGNPTW